VPAGAIESLFKARAKRTDLKVLFTSGFPGTSNGHRANLEPGDVLLSKPYHRHDLAKAIGEALSAPSVERHRKQYSKARVDGDLNPLRLRTDSRQQREGGAELARAT
jgi:hypothetical protein